VLTALAVAIGVGRVVPELSDAKTSWPDALIGIAFAIYGVWLFLEGNSRARAEGQSGASDVGVELALAAAGPALGVVVIALIAFRLECAGPRADATDVARITS
jgi:hypothetical protein